MTIVPHSSQSVDELRRRHYNATVDSFHLANTDLLILVVRPDDGIPPFQAGQYTTLGLGYWEPRADGCDQETLTPDLSGRLVQRAYSISSPILDQRDRPLRISELDSMEFYIVLIRHGEHRVPALTPRLFALSEGARLYVGRHPKGHYVLPSLRPHDNLIFLATGTGEAPHNAMLGELFASGHRGRILNVVSVRNEPDLAYLPTHRRIESQWNNYRYVPLTTREPRNVDPSHPLFVGKRRLQDFVTSGALAEQLGQPIDPATCHVFLCGNPTMVGIPMERQGDRVYPEPTGLIEIFERMGFHADPPRGQGNIHFEKYW